MSQPVKLKTPLTDEDVSRLKAGDAVSLSGVIYTGRDAAHKRITQAMAEGREIPFPLEGAVIFYVGPSPAPPGKVIGAAGPTTSYRMDPFAPTLIKNGLKAMIGKGKRNQDVKEAMQKHKAVYLAAIGGAGALVAKAIKEAEVIAYPDLGPEAVRRLVVEDMPLICVNDVNGGDLYQQGKDAYKKA
ncbi:Fe-S-containing hydro-lyase [Dethiosulfatarculus sandiegensis]|uniref:Fumarate hydratase n=1 Tax=Dethiosulfatarculus sandiegensis TaxID=1429043 RepID=A0A0D2HL03_9BACT|nr:Fe-S-containing hydro-lyase [Dethiosulfatarculus sandiegensis]KIX11323.1 fumarate hydratase [Dethiosulfatarculus sandiegensis]